MFVEGGSRICFSYKPLPWYICLSFQVKQSFATKIPTASCIITENVKVMSACFIFWSVLFCYKIIILDNRNNVHSLLFTVREYVFWKLLWLCVCVVFAVSFFSTFTKNFCLCRNCHLREVYFNFCSLSSVILSLSLSLRLLHPKVPLHSLALLSLRFAHLSCHSSLPS